MTTRTTRTTRTIATHSLIVLALAQASLGCSKKDAPTAAANATAADPAAQCPATFMAIPNQASVTHFACTCKPGTPLGPVWGKGPFTKDSTICSAGTFVSAVSFEVKSEIELTAAPACSKYEAGPTVGNVTPQKRGKFDQGSFCVDRFGGCECP